MKKIIKKIIFAILKTINFTLPRFISSYGYRIPINGTIGYYNTVKTEKWMLDLLVKLYKNQDYDFIDVGTNIGQTLMKVKSIDKNINYVGFEPNPLCCHYINNLIKINKFDFTTIVPSALYKSNILLNFYSEDEDSTDATILKDLRTNRDYIKNRFVPAFSFDEIYSVLNIGHKKTIIKIDTEGSELEIIKGMHGFIEAKKPMILCEVLLSDDLSKSQFVHDRCDALKNLLDGLNYNIYQICKSDNLDNVTALKHVNFFNEGVWNPHTSPALCDYIFIHKTIESDILELF